MEQVAQHPLLVIEVQPVDLVVDDADGLGVGEPGRKLERGHVHAGDTRRPAAAGPCGQRGFLQAIRSARPGGHVGYVGVAHGVELPGRELFFAEVHLLGGPAPVRRFLPDLISRIEDRSIDPGKVFDLTLPLDQAAEGYRAMDERRAIKTLLQP